MDILIFFFCYTHLSRQKCGRSKYPMILSIYISIDIDVDNIGFKNMASKPDKQIPVNNHLSLCV